MMIENLKPDFLAENPQGELLKVHNIYKGESGTLPKESWVVTAQVLIPVPSYTTVRQYAPGDIWLWKPPSDDLIKQYRKEYP